MSFLSKIAAIFFIILLLILVMYLFPSPFMYLAITFVGSALIIYQTVMVLKDKGT